MHNRHLLSSNSLRAQASDYLSLRVLTDTYLQVPGRQSFLTDFGWAAPRLPHQDFTKTMAFSKPQFVPCACRDLFLTDSRKPLSCALLFFHCTKAFFSSQYQVCFIPNMYFSVSEVFMVVFFTANQVVSLYLCTRPLVKVLGRSHSDSILIFYCKFSFILLERHMGLPPELC